MAKTYNPNEAVPGELGNLRRLVYFVAVVETGSFTAAAKRLGITKAVVSQQVARLEEECRTSLLVRTTRKVQVTEVGLAFYRRCTSILREADDAFGELAEASTEPSGTLRLTAPLDYGISVVVPAVAAFNQRYPKCKVDVALSDQRVDLMSSPFELAIRVGWLVDPNLQARKIGMFRQLLVAPPGMRSALQGLSRPEELVRFPFVANAALNSPLRWSFSLNATERRIVDVSASVYFDATLAVREAVREGAGLSVLPDFAIADDLATGRLLHVLPQWTLPAGGIHAVFPSARFRPIKVRAFVDLVGRYEQQRNSKR